MNKMRAVMMGVVFLGAFCIGETDIRAQSQCRERAKLEYDRAVANCNSTSSPIPNCTDQGPTPKEAYDACVQTSDPVFCQSAGLGFSACYQATGGNAAYCKDAPAGFGACYQITQNNQACMIAGPDFKCCYDYWGNVDKCLYGQ